VFRAGHDRLAAMRRHRVGDLDRIGCHRHTPDIGLLGPPQHMHDHREARDIEQRLAGQPGGGHPSRNQHQNTGIGHRLRARPDERI
jgi:hypothetical protein